jgi:uncharacterized repeat protein (TIGR03803 family)
LPLKIHGSDYSSLGTTIVITGGSPNLSTLAAFNDVNGAASNGLVEDASGNLFGTTSSGGQTPGGQLIGDGTVFEVKAGSGTITTLATFNGTNGALPNAGLIEDGNGNLYGTAGGTASGDGTVFEIMS